MRNSGLNNPIILFDGVCNLCSGLVQFTIRRDPNGVFKFASLQSDMGESYLRKFNMPNEDYSSFILIEGERYYLKSTAILRYFKRLSGFWPLLYLLIIIPRFIRDYFYDIVARNRYKWFGKKEICFVPTIDLKDRFLENTNDENGI